MGDAQPQTDDSAVFLDHATENRDGTKENGRLDLAKPLLEVFHRQAIGGLAVIDSPGGGG